MIRPLEDLPKYEPKGNRPHRDNEIYLFEFSLDCVSSVIFGPYMSGDKKKQIVDTCKHYSIKFHQAYIVRDEKDEFGKPSCIKMISAEEFSSMDELYSYKPHTFVKGKEEIKYRKPLEITTLGELPYYADYPDIVSKLYNDLARGKG